SAGPAEIDYQRAFQDAPVGQVIVRDRLICACNKAFGEMFGGRTEAFAGTSFEHLYPTQAHCESTGVRVG
ncbi:PAS domain-containing protein, partial [Serratia marcescens]|uniref:PAS domain-containing protein n=1 Tax=Serratia marcescens TaxID=615 RepID=UPI0013DC63CC